MKTLIKTLFTVCTVLFVLSSCQRVAPNYAGVLMENYGKAGKEGQTGDEDCLWRRAFNRNGAGDGGRWKPADSVLL